MLTDSLLTLKEMIFRREYLWIFAAGTDREHNSIESVCNGMNLER